MTDSWIVALCGAPSCGDCNQDGRISILDSLTAAKHAAGLLSLTGAALANCNVIGVIAPSPGAVVNVLDALTLAQSSAGIPVALACC